MSTTTVESLELQIKSSSSQAVAGIDALTSSLLKLRNATKGGIGLTSVANQVRNLDTALSSVDGSSADKIDKLATSLSKLSSLGRIKISSSIGNQLKNISSAVSSLDGKSYSSITSLSTALAGLGGLGKASGLQSTITQLNKLPAIAKELEAMDLNGLCSNLNRLTASLTPLANQANTISGAFNKLPSTVGRLDSATRQASASNEGMSFSYINLWAKARMAYNTVRIGADAISSWITKSNEYIEDVNLFTASMGEYANAAQKYAEKVGDLMGIDPGQFMRYEGVFNTIIEGFGVAGDKAYIMSKNLTQLGYDLSSFYNISFEDSMQKLQSGISGELEPLRRLGYDLSVARLQQEAYNLGISKSVANMTQAEKSQLRYYAIMTQVTVAQGDMARTLNAPANQIRVLQAQVVMCARALGNIFIPALNAVLPYAIAVAKVIRMLAASIASLFGFKMPKVDYSGVKTMATGLGDAANNAGALGNNAGSAAKGLGSAAKKARELKKDLMGIDELHVLSSNNDYSTDYGGTGSGGGVGTGGIGGGDLGFDLPQYDFLGKLIDTKASKIFRKIKKLLSSIAAIATASLLAVGLILLVTGANIPLAISLIAAGATGLVALTVLNWNSMSKQLARTLSVVTAMLGTFMFALGSFLIFSGSPAGIALGVGMMVAGATSIGVSAHINWTFIPDKLRSVLGYIEALCGGFMLAYGLMLTLSGANIPVGIAMIAAGAVMGANAIGLNWNAMPKKLRKVLGIIDGVVGGALLALGALFTFTGVDVIHGIMLLAAGAATLAAGAKLNWGAITGDLKTAINTIVAIVSGALLGIGVILTLFGIYPMGVALIAAGVVGLGVSTVNSIKWGAITDPLRKTLTDILVICGQAMLAIGAILAFTDVATPVGIALMAAGVATLVGAVALNWDSIVGKLKKSINKILGIAATASLAIGLILLFTPFMGIGIGLIAAGMASEVAMVVMNWDSVCNWVKKGLSKVEDEFNGFKKSVKKTFAGIGNDISDWAGSVDKHFKKSYSGIKKAGTQWADKFEQGFSDKFNDVNSWVKEHITNPFNNGLKNNPLDKVQVSMADNSQKWSEDIHTWWNNATSGDFSLKAGVQLVKDKWKSIKDWIGNVPLISQGVALTKTNWDSVKNWIGNIPNIDQFIDLKKTNWESVKGWIGTLPNIDQFIDLKKKWTTVKNWIGNVPTIDQQIHLAKKGWTTVKGWIGNPPSIGQAIHLLKRGWSTVSNFIGTTSSVGVSLWRRGWSSISSFVGTHVTVGVQLVRRGWSSLRRFIGLSTGGYYTGHGFKLFQNGGYMKNGFSQFWDSVPKYANGTNSAGAHGSMFVAGENGAEMVGHINGQTEVLNQSQIAQAMRSAVIAGMSQFTGYWKAINSTITLCANAVIAANVAAMQTVNAAAISAQNDNAEMISTVSSQRTTTSVDVDIDYNAFQNAMYNALIRASYEQNGTNDSDVKIYLDSDVIYRKVVQKNNEHVLQTGESEFSV